MSETKQLLESHLHLLDVLEEKQTLHALACMDTKAPVVSCESLPLQIPDNNAIKFPSNELPKVEKIDALTTEEIKLRHEYYIKFLACVRVYGAIATVRTEDEKHIDRLCIPGEEVEAHLVTEVDLLDYKKLNRAQRRTALGKRN